MPSLPPAAPFSTRCSPRYALHIALVAVGSLGLGACTTGSNRPDVTAAITSPATPDAARAKLADLQKRYETNPADAATGIAYGNALRLAGQRAQATAVLQQVTIRNPRNPQVAGAYGRALAENGQLQQAFDVLAHAHTPDRPDWRVLNVQGAVLDQMGRNTEAQDYYRTALKIVPGEPTVLSNLGLSYAFAKDLPRAEATLREAAANPKADSRVRQNLALVLSLQGRLGEAEKLARADLPPAEAQASIDNLRRLAASAPKGTTTVAGSAARPNPALASEQPLPVSTQAQAYAPAQPADQVAALPGADY
ncbi:tetratricopeptide repeat protein [Bosea sp. 117]|uniref:tetratricopeptide repeat protein n=1 Tax=Bosea sp. 117 TaxID=1125973 RepID=UPI0009E03DDC|nr:tetratricopeptide repeat protein [Bosea sp. 117]